MRIGDRALTVGELAHLIATEVGTEPPKIRVPLAPPDFTVCVAHLEANAKEEAAKALAEGTTVEAGSFKARCQKQYDMLLKQTVKRWISGEWTVGAAEEDRVSASAGIVHERFVKDLREYKSPSEYQKYLRETGQTTADILRSIRWTLDGERIRSLIDQTAAHITTTDLRRYYRIHPLQFKVLQRRDLFIVRTKTKAEAEKVRREIARGRSFASAANAATLAQPIYSEHGYVRGLTPGRYHETAINQAIFSAKRGVLEPPVQISLGWYVFKVQRIHWGRQKSFAEAEPLIRQILPERRREHMLAAATKRWRAKWSEKTDCAPAYVVQKCRQFKPTAETPAEDPYTFS